MTIRAGGERMFESGVMKLFEGFPESLKYRANVSLKMKIFLSPIIWEVYKTAYRLGLVPLTAELHFPLHMTLLEANCDQSEWAEKTAMWHELEKVSFVCLPQTDADLRFSHLVINNSNDVLLMSDQIPSCIVNFRKKIAEVYERHGLQVLPLDDSMHMSIQRLPEASNKEVGQLFNLKEYYQGIRALEKIQPQIVRVIGLYCGPAMSLLTQKPS